ncbi:MAG: magnesium-translocating P-type ATPase [Candidatus Micrarchaeia archaeon]|jgi:Mg2+-importing ATPase
MVGNKDGARRESLSISQIAAMGEPALLLHFGASKGGLSHDEARRRHAIYGYNEPEKKKETPIILQALHEFKDPLSLVLIGIAVFSLVMGSYVNAALIFGMVVVGAALSFIQEHKAGKEAKKLTEMVSSTATVLRDGKAEEMKMRLLVPGDIVFLSAGDIIPADVRILSEKDLHINQASLTGESFPVEKTAGIVRAKENDLNSFSNICFMGSNVVIGSAVGLVAKTGMGTQFGALAAHITGPAVETSFDKGVKGYVSMMMKLIFVMVLITFLINAVLKEDLAESLLFALAVAVGLAPEMLPMMVALNLSNGAIAMSKKRVIVKKLSAIQNFGAMDVLCTDKTGTLTLGEVVLERYFDLLENDSEEVLRYAYLNSYFQTGLKNLMDEAVMRRERFPTSHVEKVDEMPFDFSRKMMSVVVDEGKGHVLIAKGAPEEIISRCSGYEVKGKILTNHDHHHRKLMEVSDKYRKDGFRVLALAYRKFPRKQKAYGKQDERELVLMGYMIFLDPPKPSAKKAISALEALGVRLKVLTGDNELVTKKICSEVGIDISGIAIGEQVERMDDFELSKLVECTSIFARLTPFQKERIIGALQKNGHTVGYMGDGINDAPPLKHADVGISVNNAADIAKETADIILLKKSLMVIVDGVVEGRKTHANILKYIKMGSSSNFGNMFSVVGASIFLPFLPMLPIQILLNNFLYDMSQVTIPSDNVDPELVAKPCPWDVGHIKKVMFYLGPVSSLFDFATFAACILLSVAAPVFQTVWFLESLMTQTLVIHIVRTPKIPFLESRPSRMLLISSFAIVIVGWAIVYSPVGHYFGFEAPEPVFAALIFGIVLAYFALVQLVKMWFAKKYGWK